MGQHIWTLDKIDLNEGMKWFRTVLAVYFLALCFIKLSILLQYLRVFPGKRFRGICYSLMGFIAVYTVATLVPEMVLCKPSAPHAVTYGDPGKCVRQEPVWWVAIVD